MLDNTGLKPQVQAEICRLAARHRLADVILQTYLPAFQEMREQLARRYAARLDDL